MLVQAPGGTFFLPVSRGVKIQELTWGAVGLSLPSEVQQRTLVDVQQQQAGAFGLRHSTMERLLHSENGWGDTRQQ
ncbi:unnamed protein product [Gadus morhua 'NCC']